MKKIIKILFFLICIFISITSYCYADENTALVTAEVVSSYTFIMPQSISLPLDNPNDIECCIDFDNLLLEDGYGLEVTIDHDNFKHTLNPSRQFSYTVDTDTQIVTAQNKEACFKIYVDEPSLDISPPGKYTSRITLTIKYIKL